MGISKTNSTSRIFTFSSNAPPPSWQTAHTRALFETTRVDGRGALGVLTRNRPVPRNASAHYYRTGDNDKRNFYFY